MTHTFRIVGRPWSLNRERSLHRYQRAALVDEWRTHAAWIATSDRTARNLGRVTVTVDVFQRGPLQDTANAYPCVKAILDGLVDAGVIEDDTGEHVSSITLNAPIRVRSGIEECVVVTVTPL